MDDSIEWIDLVILARPLSETVADTIAVNCLVDALPGTYYIYVPGAHYANDHSPCSEFEVTTAHKYV